MFKHILIPLDGSNIAEKAVPAAVELASKFHSQLTIVHVLTNLPQILQDEEKDHDDLFDRVHDTAHESAEKYLQEQKEKLLAQGVPVVHYQVVDGRSPADAILSVAELQRADSIVMSTHGRSGINRWVFGSVAEKVLRGANVPVVLVRASGAE